MIKTILLQVPQGSSFQQQKGGNKATSHQTQAGSFHTTTTPSTGYQGQHHHYAPTMNGPAGTNTTFASQPVSSTSSVGISNKGELDGIVNKTTTHMHTHTHTHIIMCSYAHTCMHAHHNALTHTHTHMHAHTHTHTHHNAHPTHAQTEHNAALHHTDTCHHHNNAPHNTYTHEISWNLHCVSGPMSRKYPTPSYQQPHQAGYGMDSYSQPNMMPPDYSHNTGYSPPNMYR